MSNVVSSIKKFNNMIHNIPDDNKSIYEFYDFFKSLSFVHSKNIPFVELGTILKHKKPVIFYGLKALPEMNYTIKVVTSVHMDLHQALNNINEMIGEEDR